MRRMGIGLQLYTIRDETSKDFEGTLRKVAALGYEGVEFAGYGDMQAADLRALLDELNLKAIGSHVGPDRLRDHLEEEISINKQLGSEYIVCPYMPEELRGEVWGDQIKLFDEIAKQLSAQGLKFAYHNHDFEFKEHLDGQYVFDAIFSAAPEVWVEMDVCWVQAAGLDPLEYIRKYANRLPVLHLKDMRQGSDGIETVILGEGEVDLKEVISASSDAQVEWLIVEQDHCQLPSLTSIERSMNWLKEHYLAQFT